MAHLFRMAARVSRPTAESAWRRRPAERSQWLRPIDAARLARTLNMRVVVKPDGTVEFDGTAQDAQFQQKSQQHHGPHGQHGGRKKIEGASPADLKRGRRQADGLPSRMRDGVETNTHEAFLARRAKQQRKAAEVAAAQPQALEATEAAEAVAAAAAAAEEAAPMDEEARQASTSEPRPIEVGGGKRRAVAAEAAAYSTAAASEAVATMGKAAVEMTPNPTARKQARDGVPSPRRPGVVRPGAAKRAQPALHATAYAATMVKARVRVIFDEMVAGAVVENASAAAAIEQTR